MDALRATNAVQAEEIKRLREALEHIAETSNEARTLAVAGTALKEISK